MRVEGVRYIQTQRLLKVNEKYVSLRTVKVIVDHVCRASLHLRSTVSNSDAIFLLE